MINFDFDNSRFILNEHGEPVREPDLLTWAHWFEEATKSGLCRVAMDFIEGSNISTVFLGMNHGFGGGPPLVWETLVRGAILDGEMDRCGGGRGRAQEMHALMIEQVKLAAKDAAPKN